MNNIEPMLSCGIDIGTTTTQVVFSRLTLEQSGGFGQVPSVSITEREIIFEGAIHLTPLTEDDAIDAKAVAALIQEDFQSAGFSPADVQTGAVIITGETARKRNAAEVLSAISSLAGDFVAAEAGPDLESILAGRGAGADILSEKTGKKVLNIDIGGGTSNLCLFADGKPVECTACNIGARLVEFNRHGQMEHINSTLLSSCEKAGIKPENLPTEEMCGLLADALASIAGLAPMTAFARALLIPGEKAISACPDIISFSGGVAACMKEDEQPKEGSRSDTGLPSTAENNLFPYGDLGLLLARAVRQNSSFATVDNVCGAETVRATVTGAASFSMEVSGSTVFCRDVTLPLKNIPVFSIEDYRRLQLPSFALALQGPASPSFQEVESIADALCFVLAESEGVIPILLEHDFAKALGQALKRRLKTGPILCLDGISVKQGDYIDIGEPIAGGLAYPVTVKTLVFGPGIS